MTGPSHTHHIIRCKDVTVRYGRLLALDKVSVEIPCGSLTALVGPNGAGKSTLLRAILGWHRLDTGEIRIGDAHPQHVLPRLAYLPQRQMVDWDFPITVRELVEQGRYPALGLLGRFKQSDTDKVQRAMEELDLLGLEGRQIRMLSGGQQQRVFLARALAQGADIFLLDEPFTGLDRFATAELTHILLNWRAQGRTVIAAIHDIELARKHFANAVVLARHVLAAGPVKESLSETVLAEAFKEKHCTHDNPLGLIKTADFPQ